MRNLIVLTATPSAGVIPEPIHIPAERLIEYARRCHKVAQALRKIGQTAGASAYDVRRRVLLDDARQGRRRRPHGRRCDDRAGYGFHVCAKDSGHPDAMCRCRCGEEWMDPF